MAAASKVPLSFANSVKTARPTDQAPEEKLASDAVRRAGLPGPDALPGIRGRAACMGGMLVSFPHQQPLDPLSFPVHTIAGPAARSLHFEGEAGRAVISING